MTSKMYEYFKSTWKDHRNIDKADLKEGMCFSGVNMGNINDKLQLKR